MTDGRPHPSVDELLDGFIAAWHAGDAPSLERWAQRAAPGAQEELTQLIAAFLELAPTVEASTARGLELVQDPLVHRLAALEGDWWDAREGVAWGARLRALRERSGLSVDALGTAFAGRFGLASAEVVRAPSVIEQLESGVLPSSGVTARAARALEELVGAARGALAAGGAPAFGGALLRSDLPADAQEREEFVDLLRHVDDALPPADEIDGAGAPAGDGGSETLQRLLGA